MPPSPSVVPSPVAPIPVSVPSPVPAPSPVQAPSPTSPSSVPAPSPTSPSPVPAPSPVQAPSPTSPSSVSVPSPVPAPSPVQAPSPMSPSSVYVPSPVAPSSLYSPSVLPELSPSSNFTDPTTPSTVNGTSNDALMLQQFVLAVVATMLCVLLMFRNKERIMKKTFRSRQYTSIVDSSSEGEAVHGELSESDEGIKHKTVELPEIDDIHNIAVEV